jgi:hypothetical protein
MIATATSTLDFGEVDSSFTKVRGRKQPVENPSTPIPSTFQGLKNPPSQCFGLDV